MLDDEGLENEGGAIGGWGGRGGGEGVCSSRSELLVLILVEVCDFTKGSTRTSIIYKKDLVNINM